MAEQITFARSLYAPEAVEAAAAAYAELAEIAVTVGADTIEVTVDKPDPELASVLLDELSNHALYETILRARKGG